MSGPSCSHPIASPRPTTRHVSERQTTPSMYPNVDAQTYVISKFFTQNAHGLRQRARDGDGDVRTCLPTTRDMNYRALMSTLSRRPSSKGMSLTRSYTVIMSFATTEDSAITTSAALISFYPRATTKAGKPRELDHQSRRMQQESLPADSLVSTSSWQATIVMGNQYVANTDANNLHSPLYRCIIHAPKPVTTSSTSNFSIRSTTCLA